MLDESVTDVYSVKEICESNAADLIKLKWMKQGGYEKLLEVVDYAKAGSVKVVFGNGVACALNNLHEACVYLEHLIDSGFDSELNGFAKCTQTFPFIQLSRGQISLKPNYIGYIEEFLESQRVKPIHTFTV